MDGKPQDLDRVSREDEATLLALADELNAGLTGAAQQEVLVRVDACVDKILRKSI